jgi:hypothetical protein
MSGNTFLIVGTHCFWGYKIHPYYLEGLGPAVIITKMHKIMQLHSYMSYILHCVLWKFCFIRYTPVEDFKGILAKFKASISTALIKLTDK